MHSTKILAALTATTAAVALTACADPTTNSVTPEQSNASTAASTTHYDVSAIPTVDEIAALVPDEIRKRGTLRNGASTGYAPAEYMAADGQTPIGYDIDINRALAKVMGLRRGRRSTPSSRRSSPHWARSSTWACPPLRSPPSVSSRST